jgi:hypothetical protein
MTMPEASVNEVGLAPFCEQYVGPKSGNWLNDNTAVTVRVEQAAHGKLRLCPANGLPTSSGGV